MDMIMANNVASYLDKNLPAHDFIISVERTVANTWQVFVESRAMRGVTLMLDMSDAVNYCKKVNKSV